MPAGWPTTTAICLMLWLIGSPIWVQWHWPPTRRPRPRTNTLVKAIVARKSSHRPAHIGWPARADYEHRRSRPRPARCRSAVAAGLSNRQIADRLVVSVRTVDGHLYRIFGKLGISTRDQLIHLLSLDRTGT